MWLVKISPTVVGKKEHLTPLRMWPRQLLTGWWSMKCLLVERGERACEPFENETAALLTSNWGSAPFQMFYVRANVYLMLNEMFVGDSVKEQTHLRMWHHLLLELRIRCFKCLPCVRMFGWWSIKYLLVECGSICVETRDSAEMFPLHVPNVQIREFIKCLVKAKLREVCNSKQGPLSRTRTPPP